MVYINSRGEVVDNTRLTATNIFWSAITFIVQFFKSLIGLEDKPNKKKDDNIGGSGPISGGFGGGGSGGGGGGGGSGGGRGPGNDPGTRKFGPKGFKSITDLPPPPMPSCCGSSCG